MLDSICPVHSAFAEGPRERPGVGCGEGVTHVERGGGLEVQDVETPSLGREAAVVGPDGALGVGVHCCVACGPEKPEILLVGDGRRMEDIMIDVGVWTQIEKVFRGFVEAFWDGIGLGG